MALHQAESLSCTVLHAKAAETFPRSWIFVSDTDFAFSKKLAGAFRSAFVEMPHNSNKTPLLCNAKRFAQFEKLHNSKESDEKNRFELGRGDCTNLCAQVSVIFFSSGHAPLWDGIVVTCSFSPYVCLFGFFCTSKWDIAHSVSIWVFFWFFFHKNDQDVLQAQSFAFGQEGFPLSPRPPANSALNISLTRERGLRNFGKWAFWLKMRKNFQLSGEISNSRCFVC